MFSASSKTSLTSLDSKFSSTSQQVTVSYSSVTIFLFEAKDLVAMDRNGLSDPFCKFKLGCEKFRSRVIKKSLNPQWLEEFHLFLHDNDSRKLEISVWDWDRTLKNEVIGRTELDLAPLEHGKMYDFWLDVKEKNVRRGSVHLSVLINDKKEINELMPSLRTQAVEFERQRSVIEYQRQMSSDGTPERDLSPAPNAPLGTLVVDLRHLDTLPFSSDSEGKSVYCILQLGLVKFQTHTLKKSTNPEWNCEYTFPVNDVHSILEIIVMDRDLKGKTNTLGSLAIPLLDVQSGLKGYFLKDKKLMKFTATSIFLEMNLKYDLLSAAVRTIRPRDDAPSDIDRKVSPQIRGNVWKRLMGEVFTPEDVNEAGMPARTFVGRSQKVLVHKVNQIREVITLCATSLEYFLSLLSWESADRTLFAYVLCVAVIYFFQLYWIPIFLLVFLLRGYNRFLTAQAFTKEESDDEEVDSDLVSSSGSVAKFSAIEELVNLLPGNLPAPKFWSKYFSRETGVNFLNGVKTAHGQARFVQGVLEFMADIYERVSNVLDFTVPWLSFFAIAVLSGATVGLYFLPFRAVLFFWVTYEFAKGYFGYHNFELLDFLSRVHTKHEHKMYSLKPCPVRVSSGTV